MSWEQGAKGAAGGALAGSAFGPIGTIAGGLLGGAAGYFSGGENEQDDAYRKQLQQYYEQVNGRGAPQMGAAAQSGYSGFRSNQSDLISRLEAMSQGKGPSLASQQFKQSTDRNMSQQAGMANSGQGGPMAALAAMNNMGSLGAQASQGAAGARIAEQNMALGHLGNTINQGRGADENTNQFNAQARNQQMLQNLDARLRSQGMDDQTRMQILSQMGGLNEGQRNQVGMGDQLLAGGAGLYAMHSAQQAGMPKVPKIPSNPNGPGGGYYSSTLPKPQAPSQTPASYYNQYGVNI